MNKFASAFIAMLVATSAFAAPAEKIVAQKVVNGGFHPANYPDVSGVKILANGQVIEFKEFRDASKNESTLVATLAPASVTKIEAELAGLKKEDLKDSEVGKPMCTDTPTIIWSGANNEGTLIDLQQSYGCHELSRDDWTTIPTILNGLEDLAPIANQ